MTDNTPTVADIINAIPVLNELADTRMTVSQALQVQNDLDALNQVLQAFNNQREAAKSGEEIDELLNEPLHVQLMTSMNDLVAAGVQVKPSQVGSLVRLFGTVAENGAQDQDAEQDA